MLNCMQCVFHEYLKRFNPNETEYEELKAARCVSGLTDAVSILDLSNSVLSSFSISFCFFFVFCFERFYHKCC